VLTLLHVWANVKGVGCLSFDTINPQRATLLATRWVALADPAASPGGGGRVSAARYKPVLSPSAIARDERLWGPFVLWLRGPRLGVGVSALVDGSASDGGAAQLAQASTQALQPPGSPPHRC
jgi:hypothetical protein